MQMQNQQQVIQQLRIQQANYSQNAENTPQSFHYSPQFYGRNQKQQHDNMFNNAKLNQNVFKVRSKSIQYLLKIHSKLNEKPIKILQRPRHA